jgi:fibronectin-binding autotransporter adhesin
MSKNIKVLTGTYASGYAITAPVYTLSIAAGGYVEGVGISDTHKTTTSPTVINSGRVYGSGVGVYLQYGGSVINGGTAATTTAIVGRGSGIRIVGGTAKVTNFGLVAGHGPNGGATGVYLGAGGAITNGADSDVAAKIQGYSGVGVYSGLGKVTNFGTIVGTGRGGDGVYLADGGALTNGDAGDSGAYIGGAYGAVVIGAAAGTVTNFGTIAAVPIGHAAKPPGVRLDAGGVVTNGTTLDTTAEITGYDAVSIAGAAGTVKNLGTIAGSQTTGFRGVLLADGGLVTNGATNDTNAVIKGGVGVEAGGVATVTNFGAIEGVVGDGVVLGAGRLTNGASGGPFALIEGAAVGVAAYGLATVVNFGTILGSAGPFGYGVYLMDGGVLTNGAAGDTQALISGGFGISAIGAAATVQNFGTIAGQGSRFHSGVLLSAGGSITNGSAADVKATISGYDGVGAASAATIQNFGTIQADGYGRYVGKGAYLAGGGALTNGSATDAQALIKGDEGVYLYGSGETVTNFGTILGEGGTSVAFGSSGDTLVVEAGSVFVGAVDGGGGVLDLASKTGTIDAIAAGTVVVGAAPSITTFSNFGTLEVGAGAKFTLSGSGALGAGGTTTLDIAGTLTVTGDLTGAGTVAGAGTLALAGGMAALANGSSLTIAEVLLTGHAAVNVGSAGLTYAGLWSQTGGSTLSVAAGDAIDFTGAGNIFGGPLNGAGTIGFTSGSDTLSATHISGATSVQIENATATLSGAIVLAGTISAMSSDLIVAAGGVTLSGGGVLELSEEPDVPPTYLTGATAAATLTNVNDKIDGTAHLGGGQMTLINDAAGVITGDGEYALTIDTGANTIVNAGGASGLNIVSAVNNTGTLVADSYLTVTGTVTGAGTVQIGAGLADFTKVFTENVTFTGSGDGTLELDHSHAYTGQITGFSKTGTTTLQLDDVSFISGTTKATYSGTTTSGVLTVTDGTHVAKITLEGDYTGSTFTVSAATGGGTAVVDPTSKGLEKPVDPMSLHPFVAAMASLGAGGTGGVAAREADSPSLRAPLMAAPRAILT